ncbi:hypothetical protein Kpol_1066p1, partial [Vanderwaltozyma polyspora DSM 70294]
MSLRTVDAIIPRVPVLPYPINVNYCEVINGFGRGSSDLGIPTANVDIHSLPKVIDEKLSLGVYFGFCKLKKKKNTYVGGIQMVERVDGREVEYNYGSQLEEEAGDLEVLPVVLSIGVNPFYNKGVGAGAGAGAGAGEGEGEDRLKKTVELHICM